VITAQAEHTWLRDRKVYSSAFPADVEIGDMIALHGEVSEKEFRMHQDSTTKVRREICFFTLTDGKVLAYSPSHRVMLITG
jgi:hypothetical protein